MAFITVSLELGMFFKSNINLFNNVIRCFCENSEGLINEINPINIVRHPTIIKQLRLVMITLI